MTKETMAKELSKVVVLPGLTKEETAYGLEKGFNSSELSAMMKGYGLTEVIVGSGPDQSYIIEE